VKIETSKSERENVCMISFASFAYPTFTVFLPICVEKDVAGKGRKKKNIRENI
jgi:hypothetical protein